MEGFIDASMEGRVVLILCETQERAVDGSSAREFDDSGSN